MQWVHLAIVVRGAALTDAYGFAHSDARANTHPDGNAFAEHRHLDALGP